MPTMPRGRGSRSGDRGGFRDEEPPSEVAGHVVKPDEPRMKGVQQPQTSIIGSDVDAADCEDITGGDDRYFQASYDGFPQKRKLHGGEHTYDYSECDFYESEDDYVDTDSQSIQSERLLSGELNKEEKKEELAVRTEKIKGRPRRGRGFCRWPKPLKGFHRVDTDGSVKRGKCGGYGAIIRDSDGKFEVAAADVSDHLSLVYNQVQGVKLGLELAKARGLGQIWVYTNSLMVYELVSNPYLLAEEELDSDVVNPVIRDIIKLKNEFSFIKFDITFRACNQAADYLSKLFRKEHITEESEIKTECHQT